MHITVAAIIWTIIIGAIIGALGRLVVAWFPIEDLLSSAGWLDGP
jgi:hypothetical protein